MKPRLINIALLLALIVGLMSPGVPGQYRRIRDRDYERDRGRRDRVETVYCESGDGKRHWCSEGIGGRVSLVRQRSGSRCTQGRTWGVDRAGIWVDRGCRADFEIRH
ncbi:MAG TPA: DUF3011 domain-containing protein [Blastocatellia bacterium]|nr:DUF3011 domain-containing protein [Blastocatellia bacterium]